MKKLSFLTLVLSAAFILPSCIDEDHYGDPLTVYDQNGNPRKTTILNEDEDEEDDEENDDEENGKGGEENFANLTGVYEGVLFSLPTDEKEAADADIDKLKAEGDSLDVTVTAQSGNKLDLALYNANIQGISLGDLIFTGISTTYDAASQTYSFSLQNKEVSIMNGMIQATVNVEGSVKLTGELSFSVAIQSPQLTLQYEGTRKKTN